MSNTEWKEIKEGLDKIGSYIPIEMTDWVWDNYKRLSNSNEAKPCNCYMAAAHWKRAIGFLRDWVNQNQINEC